MPQSYSTAKKVGASRASMVPFPKRSSMLPSSRQSMQPLNNNSRQSVAPLTSRKSVVPSNSRHSIAPSRAGPYSRNQPPGSGQSASEMMAASVQRTNMRKSFIPGQGPPGSNSRNTQSSTGIGSFSNSLGVSTPSSRDPRPLRDRNYLAVIAQEIYDYLLDNKFEIEMRHPLTQKTLKTPTQKDFVFIFQWLYKRLDPGYKFTKSIENEVYFLLKTINYPFLESINKSQISAVGGQNWPNYLGMLHWLVELNMSLEVFDSKAYLDADNDDTILDQIFIRYVSKSYKAFLNNEDDYSEYKIEMEQEFDQYSEGLVAEIEGLAQENQTLEEKYLELSRSAESLVALLRKGEALESDLVKFKAYIDTMEKRKIKWTNVIEKIIEELSNSENELKSIQTEKEELQRKVSAQGLTPTDIDRMNSEREKLGRALENISARLEEMNKICNEKENAAQSALYSLEGQIQKYTTSIYRIGILSASDYNEINFDVSLDLPLSDENLGKRPDVLLKGVNVQNKIRTALQKYRYDIGVKVHKEQDESIKLHELIDRISENIGEKKDQVENLEAKLNASKITYEAVYETMNSDSTVSHAEIERLERELHAMKISVNHGILQVNQRSQGVAIEYDQLQRSVQVARDKMNSEVEQMISRIINFKLHIQSTLEDYENFVVDEWNTAVSKES